MTLEMLSARIEEADNYVMEGAEKLIDAVNVVSGTQRETEKRIEEMGTIKNEAHERLLRVVQEMEKDNMKLKEMVQKN